MRALATALLQRSKTMADGQAAEMAPIDMAGATRSL
jgi:hypothetical protein